MGAGQVALDGGCHLGDQVVKIHLDDRRFIQPGFIETDMTAQINSNPVMRKMSEHTMSPTILLRRTGRGAVPATR